MDELAELGSRLEASRAQIAAVQQELAVAKKEHAEAASASEHRLQVW